MENIKKSKKTIEIGDVGTLLLNEECMNVINELHQLVGNTEWSGTLFIKLESGDLKTLKNLVFKADFIYPMDIGSHSLTSIDYNAEIMKAYDINEDLIEYTPHLVHSHHNMSSFFSSVDSDELIKNSELYNHYISLIVNFKGDYCAKIAFPTKIESIAEYELLDEDAKPFKMSSKSSEDGVLVGKLEIVKPEKNSWINERYNELKANNLAKKVIPKTVGTTYNYDLFEKSRNGAAITNGNSTDVLKVKQWFLYLAFNPSTNFSQYESLNFKYVPMTTILLESMVSNILRLNENQFELYLENLYTTDFDGLLDVIAEDFLFEPNLMKVFEYCIEYFKSIITPKNNKRIAELVNDIEIIKSFEITNGIKS
jgi:hypothetical protein